MGSLVSPRGFSKGFSLGVFLYGVFLYGFSSMGFGLRVS